ncbi:hypothetical protein ACH5RR_011002 [Cinchona calisaya]|uniref:TPX2 C-terminal domain-containing protein n=1 Tax=Cinchona calisaya TaxID=153742 RepID=A0ABD3A625_9GENT
MGDSTCLMHPFSYASGLPNQPNQGNPMHALGESVSFGRFMSESLAWEKWSTFSHNRYVEEAERYAQPGSVAQKKAFFEAHYKRIAAKKAAALLEQANSPAAAEEPDESNVIPDDSKPPLPLISSHVAVNEQSPEPEVKNEDAKQQEFVIVLAQNDQIPSVDNPIEPATDDEVMEPEEAPLQTPVTKYSSNPPDNFENQDMVSGSELSGTTPQMEKPLLKHNLGSDEEVSSVKSKKKSAFSSFKSSVYRKTSKVPCTPTKPITPRLKKESNATTTTPITKRSTILDFTDKKRSTSKTLHAFIYSTPAKGVLTPSANRKTENSRIAPDFSKASRDCMTPPRTQDMATPCPANTRTKTPVDGNKTTGPKWNILSAVCSKSLTACRNKLQSPTLSTPFILRTEERAERRKQKLEEKFNSKEVHKVQLQTKFKEKAELELRKLRQSFCFKARPLPNFYKERETQNNQTKKKPVTQPQSPPPKLERKPSSKKMQGTVSLPSSISLNKNGNSKHVPEKNGRTTNFPASLPEMIHHENASPNIQY